MRRRILAAVVAMTALAVLAFFIPAALSIRQAERRGQLLELQREASIVANHLSLPTSGSMDELESELVGDHPLGLYTTDGELFAGDGPLVADRIVELALEGNFAEGYVGGDLVAAVPVSATATHPPLVVRIEAPGSETSGRYLRALAVLALTGLAIVAAATAVGVWVARRLNRPVEQLTEWASGYEPGAATAPPATGIGELDALRAALLENRARIEELLARERSFSSHVSHQLRTPVAAMRVAVETELEAPRPDATAVLHESLGQLDRLESTITSLLALARHVEGRLSDTDLLALVAEQVSHWRAQAERLGRALEVDGEPARAMADPDAVRHVLDVLLDNALRHGWGTIRVRVSNSDAAVAIDVADEGPTPSGGDAFADIGSDTGHGIGLRLARTLAESTHGRLQLLDAPHTTFRLTLPHQTSTFT